MSNLKVSFSPDFFSEKATRKKSEINNSRDQLCADISDIYQSANAILKSEIKFDADDITEVQRADTYDIIAGIPLVQKSICDLKLTLSKAGLKSQSEQELIIALMLQTKCGLQGKLLSQIIALLLEYGNMSWIGAKKVSVDYDKTRGETIFKAQVDIVSKGNVVGKSEFAVAIKNNEMRLKHFTVEIDKNASGAKDFIKNIRKDESIANKIINFFSSLFTSTINVMPTPAKVEPLKGKYLKPMSEFTPNPYHKMRPLYAASDARIKSDDNNLPRRSESASEIVREHNYKPVFRTKSADDASKQLFEQKMRENHEKHEALMQERQAKFDARMSEIEKHQQEVREFQAALAEKRQAFEDTKQMFDAATKRFNS